MLKRVRRIYNVLLLFLLAILWGLGTAVAVAQAPTPEPPPSTETGIPQVHVVADGEVLVSIAAQYNTTAEAIQILNNLPNADALYVGQELIIPGAEGAAVPIFYIVDVGDTLADIAARYNTTMTAVAEQNNIVNPERLPGGSVLALLSRTGSTAPQVVTGTAHVVGRGETLLEVAARYGLEPGRVAAMNGLDYPVRLYEGQRLRIPNEAGTYRYLPEGWTNVALSPNTAVQGSTLAFFAAHSEQGTPSGQLIDPEGRVYELQFAPHEGAFVALAGLDAFAAVGRYELVLAGEGLSRPWRPFRQTFEVGAGDFEVQEIVVSEALAPLLAPEIRASEDEYLERIFTIYSAEKRWEGLFQYPVTGTFVTARYGDARSYNGGPVEVFHSGIDFGGQVGTPILAPAGGMVIFTGTLNLRGETVIIDHGLGVMTAYYHLSKIYVKVGDVITSTQQVIAEGGSTGLSTGPHLHWDVRVNGAAVNPVPWVERRIP